jgi:hypothetical protein
VVGARLFKDRDGGQRAPPNARVFSDSYLSNHRASGDSRLIPTGRCMRLGLSHEGKFSRASRRRGWKPGIDHEPAGNTLCQSRRCNAYKSRRAAVRPDLHSRLRVRSRFAMGNSWLFRLVCSPRKILLADPSRRRPARNAPRYSASPRVYSHEKAHRSFARSRVSGLSRHHRSLAAFIIDIAELSIR